MPIKPKTRPKGMSELFTTPREHEADVVKSILRQNHISYKSQEENRGNISGWRICIYVAPQIVNKAAKLVDEGLLERDM